MLTKKPDFFMVELDSWKSSYRGYWSSLETACEFLPYCIDFKHSLSWKLPQYLLDSAGMEHSPVYEINSKLRPVLSIEDGAIAVRLPGFTINRRQRGPVSPEVKEPGRPYQPEKTDWIELAPFVHTTEIVAVAYYFPKSLNLIGERRD